MIRTDKPKPGPFKTGQRLKYLGKSDVTEIVRNPDGTETSYRLIFPGILVTVVEGSMYGRQGTGSLVDLGDDEPFRDETRDHVSVYETAEGRKRLIHRKDKKDWEVVRP